ncbi:unnamed protein product [Acanthoscelides obtectus]|uniref:Ig-like domain-containing protein n=1 Tax=Acanthoscelides obtectus TaxID=200917 RepID=A0A9P0M4F1_ACAOB|nr:unnamed protein product [Acanthoscelides obtectus]CAK1658632.1 Protein ZBED8 [Acanthoscelides obtectus]
MFTVFQSSDLVVLPGSTVNIPCQNMADNVAGELSTSYAWTFKKDIQRKGTIVFVNVEAKDYGNYTCSKTKNGKTEEFVHELQLITLPIYKITMEVSYSTSESCTLELEDMMYSYMPKIKRPTLDRMFASTSQRNDDGLRASYNISLLIAKSGKPHTIGEKLVLPAVEEVLKTVLHKPASDIIKRIPLSNNTVERRIDEMSSDIESILCNYL